MKNYEESYLKIAAQQIRTFAKDNCKLEDFYQKLSTIEVTSLQDLSFRRDLEFFKSVSSILTVISSIAAKPYTLNKEEDIIARSGTTNGLTTEAFRRTLQDSALWKRYGDEMIPEEVHHHQYYDEIKTYENIFIVMLIDMISLELDKYREFYISVLKALDCGSSELSVEEDIQETAMTELERTVRKVSKIKATSFYKTVSKATSRPKIITPTNILLRNQMYNAAYKFYKSMVTYDDEISIETDLGIYYFFVIVKEMKRRGMWLRVGTEEFIYKDKNISIPLELTFSNKEFSVKIVRLSDSNMYCMEILDNEDETATKHIIAIEKDDTFKTYIKPDESWDVESVDYISVWHLGTYEDGLVKVIDSGLMSERQMVETIIDRHHKTLFGSEDLYSAYCPVCRSTGLDYENNKYICPTCHSKYKILATGNEKQPHKIVFTDFRRRR
ncbi:MAG: hypothetical protein MJ238_03430 [Bacilli bacterium]|nr:hypothetical protein [Bacilli bacterium]